jgi:ATP-dependent DNA helicase RecQ
MRSARKFLLKRSSGSSQAQLVGDLFTHSHKGKTKNAQWYRLNPDEMAEKLGKERKRIVRAIEVLEERGLLEVSASDARQRYTRLLSQEKMATLVRELTERFHKREAAEMARMEQLLTLITHDGCQNNALVGYFGQVRAEPCGHCTYCLTGKPAVMPEAPPRPPLPDLLDVMALQELREAHPEALGEPRQATRFLCGLTSPALTKARLSRHELFGILEDRRFQEVLAFLERSNSQPEKTAAVSSETAAESL